ncbi:aminotransferase [Sandarakinorhabdus sp.]|uniref:aminotransferase n=1 Tax=Sandarakinorhabdus sp. TaxID=1916663 RepID=UPI003F6FBCC1
MNRPLSAADLLAMDQAHVFHPFTMTADHEDNGPAAMMVGGKGSRLTDVQGKEYIDALAGLWCVNVGYGRPELAEAMRAQAEQLPYFHGFSGMANDVVAQLSARLVKLAPAGMKKVFYGNSGSDANDTQVKIAWLYHAAKGKPAKRKILARSRGYHGVTVMTAGLTGLTGLHDGFGLPLPGISHVMAPRRIWEGHGLSDAEFAQKLADDLEATIAREGADSIAAMIMEPLMGAGGVHAPPAGYYQAIQPILKRHDILLIADEVICGFGRLGAMFGSEVFGIQPDMMTVAKGLTSAYFPLSACIVSDHVWQVMRTAEGKFGAFGHGYTYSGHPVGAAVAMANLDIIERENLVAQAAVTGNHMQEALRAAFGNHPLVGDVRGQALIGAVEFIAGRDGDGRPVAFDPSLKVSARIVNAARARGVIGRALPASDSVAFSPPFVITRQEIDTVVGVFREAADQVMGELRAAGQF